MSIRSMKYKLTRKHIWRSHNKSERKRCPRCNELIDVKYEHCYQCQTLINKEGYKPFVRQDKIINHQYMKTKHSRIKKGKKEIKKYQHKGKS